MADPFDLGDMGRVKEQLRKALEGRRQLQAEHDQLLAHTVELLDKAQKMEALLRERQRPQGEREDEVAAWLKSRGWLVSRPITIEGEAI